MKTLNERTEFDPEILRKLEDGFSYGFTNRESCLYANISESLFYEVCQNNPELLERFKILQDSPKISAKKNIVNSIRSGDNNDSKWYLERKDKDFSNKQEFKGELDGNLTIQWATEQSQLITPQENGQDNSTIVESDGLSLSPTEDQEKQSLQ